MSSYLVPKIVPSTGGGTGPVTGASNAIVNTFTSSGAISSPIVIYAGPTGPVAADKDTVAQQDKILGVTITSAAAGGEEVDFVSHGLITDLSFTFIEGPIWLGNAGALTQVKPTSGLLVQIAIAYSATEIVVDIQLNIKLA